MDRWPNLFVVGASKAGTTALHAYLDQIPEIYMSKTKEPNYFSVKTISDKSFLRPIRDKERYLSLFKKAKGQKFLGEASPTYLSDSEAPKLIHKVVPNAYIIISLRDPVERFFSHYLMLFSIGRLKKSFSEACIDSLKIRKFDPNKTILRLSGSLYSDYVKRYLEIFGPKQVKIIIFEEFIKNTKKTMEEILDFLEINRTVGDLGDKKYNPYSSPRVPFTQSLMTSDSVRKIVNYNLVPFKTRKFIREKILFKSASKPKMQENDRRTLVNYYQEDVKKLEEILGRKLPWKNFNS